MQIWVDILICILFGGIGWLIRLWWLNRHRARKAQGVGNRMLRSERLKITGTAGKKNAKRRKIS